ncbi:MAG: globin-coupled sensor protein [Synergistetes bacterium]|nr:globin-coupled sensor protein [Synergistota bacterium]MCX8127717.1 globin-coupled sensor protein [Synergistota bacterium]MDW8191368.1 globin-coupled sensor protein [Synergistota bacterium]
MIEEKKINFKKRFIDLKEEEEQALMEASSFFDKRVSELSEKLFSHLSRLGEKSHFKLKEDWREIINEYLKSLFKDPVDDAYLDKRSSLGEKIYNKGIAIEGFIGIYNPIIKAILETAFEVYREEKEKIILLIASIFKRINLDIQLIVEEYMNLIGKGIAEASEDLKNIVKTIYKIAGQTKLIALNAAIEAARAGTSGKTFTVVAQEISKLAASSAKAAEEADEMIRKHLESFVKGWE